VYEVGFAIGSRKRAYLIRHKETVGDKAVAREAGIFDTLGYHEYTDQNDLVRRLTSSIDPEPLQFSVELDHRAPVYLVEPPRVLQGSVNLAVGRKGCGKTALFIELRNKIRRDKRNVVVDLRPEGYQLIKLKEDILSYLSEGSLQHLITAFWEYLILLEVAYKLLEKDQYTHKHNHEIREIYLELQATYKVEDFSVEGDFSERLMALSRRIGDEYRTKYGTGTEQKLTTEQVTELLYRHDLAKLRDLISEYLERKATVWILFDNLDKGWSTQGVDEVDATVLR
jgi:hypothetical protein